MLVFKGMRFDPYLGWMLPDDWIEQIEEHAAMTKETAKEKADHKIEAKMASRPLLSGRPEIGSVVTYCTKEQNGVVMAAIVASVNGDLVNVAVLEPSGVWVNRLDVLFVPSETSRKTEGVPAEYCSWPD